MLKNSLGTTLNSHSYIYNAGNQRTKQTFTDGNYTDYVYDDIVQLKAAVGSESGGVSRLHEQMGYAYDTAGNLQIRTNNALVQSFTVDSLNQLSNVTRSGTLTVAGKVGQGVPPVSVTVNGNAASLYADWMFSKAGFSLVDGTNNFTAIATDSVPSTVTNALDYYLPATNACTYDANGNLTSQGLSAALPYVSYEYDDENQLTRITSTNGWRSEFTYDGKMRRRIRREYTWSLALGNWSLTNEVRYVYDGNLVLQERDSDNVARVTYTRGKDLSGGLEGAGGIGGLLARSAHSTISSQPSTSAYYHSDGNGNITALVNPQQTVVARYHYDPYGNLLAKSGSLADANLYRFSSKEVHTPSGLVYYLYRYYAPELQRWVNKDPVREKGFHLISRSTRGASDSTFNLLRFVGNNPVRHIAPFGLSMWICYADGWINHAYIWDDRDDPQYIDDATGTDQTRGCGMQGLSGSGGTTEPHYLGPPPGSDGIWTGTFPDANGNTGILVCAKIPDSEGKEETAMKCCQEKKHAVWIPWIHDCHNAARNCLKEAGIPPNTIPRYPRI